MPTICCDRYERFVHPFAELVAFVGVSDLDVAAEFYGATLGLSLSDERPFALVAEVDATMLRITKVAEVNPAPHTVLGWKVTDIAVAVDVLVSKGARFQRYEGLDQDPRGIWQSPSGAQIAWFCDPDGNNLSLTQFGAP